ncbi:hypothetical protein [Ectobacillus ponti]|uniref:Uncharacterized protein n=1 Tax=Ectobacillus ponti TaxID=2961894 RepID=A0AA41X8Z2_9BACI|nr:hypothetical protein [Ectobacillus ponti]MCP8968565.1 hypothetical protein [Ectobacillus ponti]
MKKQDIQTNAPKQPSVGVTSALNTRDPYHTDVIYPGDSVAEHKKLEFGTHVVTRDEMKQQNENL